MSAERQLPWLDVIGFMSRRAPPAGETRISPNLAEREDLAQSAM